IKYLSEFDWWLKRVTGSSLEQLKVPEGSPYSGMTLYSFLKLEHGIEEYPFIWPTLDELFLKFRKIYTLNWLDGKIQEACGYVDKVDEEKDEFESWRLAEQMVREFGYFTTSIKDLLMSILGLYYGKVTDEDGNQVGYTWSGN